MILDSGYNLYYYLLETHIWSITDDMTGCLGFALESSKGLGKRAIELIIVETGYLSTWRFITLSTFEAILYKSFRSQIGGIL